MRRVECCLFLLVAIAALIGSFHLSSVPPIVFDWIVDFILVVEAIVLFAILINVFRPPRRMNQTMNQQPIVQPTHWIPVVKHTSSRIVDYNFWTFAMLCSDGAYGCRIIFIHANMSDKVIGLKITKAPPSYRDIEFIVCSKVATAKGFLSGKKTQEVRVSPAIFEELQQRLKHHARFRGKIDAGSGCHVFEGYCDFI